jgi:hypothetical protein
MSILNVRSVYQFTTATPSTVSPVLIGMSKKGVINELPLTASTSDVSRALEEMFNVSRSSKPYMSSVLSRGL